MKIDGYDRGWVRGIISQARRMNSCELANSIFYVCKAPQMIKAM